MGTDQGKKFVLVVGEGNKVAYREVKLGPVHDGLRVVRGSSWADELPKVLRCAFRFPVDPATRSPFIGFRVVADIPSLQ